MLIGRAALGALHWGVVLNFIAEMIYAGVMLGVATRTPGAYGWQLAIALVALLAYLAGRRLLQHLRGARGWRQSAA